MTTIRLSRIITNMKIYRTALYLRRVNKLFSEEQLIHIDSIITKNPKIGVIMQGTGGLRKMRVSLDNRGKSGGARVIYYYWQEGMSAFLFSAYAKNAQEELPEKDKKDLSEIIYLIKRGLYDA